METSNPFIWNIFMPTEEYTTYDENIEVHHSTNTTKVHCCTLSDRNEYEIGNGYSFSFSLYSGDRNKKSK
jgi:hypothetical protein